MVLWSVRVGGQLVLGHVAVSSRRALEPRRPVVSRLVARLPRRTGGPGQGRARRVGGPGRAAPQPARAPVALRRGAPPPGTEGAGGGGRPRRGPGGVPGREAGPGGA